MQERLWVELGRRQASTVRLHVDTAGDAGSLMSNKRELHPGAATNLRRRADISRFAVPTLPDTEQQAVTNRVQVAGEPGIFSSPTVFGAAALRRSRTQAGSV